MESRIPTGSPAGDPTSARVSSSVEGKEKSKHRGKNVEQEEERGVGVGRKKAKRGKKKVKTFPPRGTPIFARSGAFSTCRGTALVDSRARRTPAVQFMPANDCNLRLIQLAKWFCARLPSFSPFASCAAVASTGPAADRPVGPTRMHKSAKHPGGNERFVIGRR